jgi:hypothetical protein
LVNHRLIFWLIGDSAPVSVLLSVFCLDAGDPLC